jgi:putative endonuclease
MSTIPVTKQALNMRVRRPVKLVYAETQENRQFACKREYQLKQLTKVKKEALVKNFNLPAF